jgi:pimeloyl-ACP methyl ester carboxylesterase
VEFVLVHGAYHGSWCWNLLIPELEMRGNSAVAVDLPISDPAAGSGAYAENVVEAVSDMEDPVLVGHSMGGLVIPLVAASRPVGLMVFLAAFLPQPGSSLADQRAREPIDPAVDFNTAEFTDIGDGLFTVGPNTATEMFYQDVPGEITDWAIHQLRPQSYLFMKETTPLTTWPDTPAAYIVCKDDHAINPDWERTAAQERLEVRAHEIEGGHSPFLTRPRELADLLHDIAT